MNYQSTFIEIRYDTIAEVGTPRDGQNKCSVEEFAVQERC